MGQISQDQSRITNLLVKQYGIAEKDQKTIFSEVQILPQTKTNDHLLVGSRAPFSERRSLIIETGEKQPDDVLLQQLADLGISTKSRPICVGPHNPDHEDYLEGYKHLNLPPNYLVMHGLTGAKDPDSAKKRLQQIIEYGGLLSYSERRRQGIKRHTMSPLGDLASGIDWGVPATINSKPSYGQRILFVFKRDVLKRKHLFFSDQDYGGGKSRFDDYNRYAESLGQKTFGRLPTIKPDKNTLLI